MFGYVTAKTGELRVREYDAYKSVYCGLCKQLKKSCGPFSRMFLSYDITFMALVALSLKPECQSREGRCMLNPLKKRRFVCDEPALEFSALASALMTYYKLQDDCLDEHGFGALKAQGARLLFRGVHKKAAKKLPELDRIVGDSCAALRGAEKQGGLTLDHYCDFFAAMLGTVFEKLSEEETVSRVLHEVGYFTGKWIYLIDAADDLKEDFVKGRFNAIISSYEKKEGETLDLYWERTCPTVRQYLDDTLGMLWRAFELLPVRSARGITENIVYLGMPERQKQVLAPAGSAKDKSEKRKASR